MESQGGENQLGDDYKLPSGTKNATVESGDQSVPGETDCCRGSERKVLRKIKETSDAIKMLQDRMEELYNVRIK